MAADTAGLSFLIESAGIQGDFLQQFLVVFSQVACGSLHMLSLGSPLNFLSSKPGEGPPQCVYTWGSNTSNCLGLSAANAAATAKAPPTCLSVSAFVRPDQQPQEPMPRIKQIAAGGISSAALSESGDLWLWGDMQAFIER